MQQSLTCRCGSQVLPLPSRTPLTGRPHFTLRHGPARRESNRRTLQVCAGKSKGKQQMRGGRTAPPQRPEIPTPDVDEANAEFVLFARNTMLPQWVPVTIIKGGSQAKFLADALEHEFGRALYAKVLVRQLATDIWKDKKKLDNQLKRQPNSPMKYANEIQYGFKIRDKSNPKSWHKAEGITLLPNPDTLTPTVVDRVRKFFKRS